MTRTVRTVLPSALFETAEVLVTDCGHRHVRPLRHYRAGESLDCPFCDDELHGLRALLRPPDIGADVPGGGAV